MIKTKTCSKCHKTKPLDEFHNDKKAKDGRASHCKICVKKYYQEHQEELKEYEIKYRKEHREERKEYKRKYRQKNKEKIAEGNKKYYQEHKEEIRKRTGQLPMNKNKSCSSYLGVYIAERLCRHLFKDVEVMPYGNTGYDIVCNKGKLIDVKSSTTHLRHSKYPFWAFRIDYNKIADFFILVVFDNRTDLNPLHIWMIPGKEINDKSGKSIRPSTIHKWSQWERSAEEVQMCCDIIKDE